MDKNGQNITALKGFLLNLLSLQNIRLCVYVLDLHLL